MKWIFLAASFAIVEPVCAAYAQEHGRIKKKPPTPAEVERLASDTVMNDSSLHKGDIVSTDRGFFLYRGVLPDGYSGDFIRVPNPLLPR